jgi:hypothetical protein
MLNRIERVVEKRALVWFKSFLAATFALWARTRSDFTTSVTMVTEHESSSRRVPHQVVKFRVIGSPSDLFGIWLLRLPPPLDSAGS